MVQHVPRTRVIGLGNPILTDDAVGLEVVRRLRARVPVASAPCDIVEAEVGGFELLEMLVGFERVILVDAVRFDDVEPGTVMSLQASDLRTSLRLRGVHDIDLPTVLQLGEKLGYAMPTSVEIFAVQAKDTLTLGERLTPQVAAAVPDAVARVERALAW